MDTAFKICLFSSNSAFKILLPPWWKTEFVYPRVRYVRPLRPLAVRPAPCPWSSPSINPAWYIYLYIYIPRWGLCWGYRILPDVRLTDVTAGRNEHGGKRIPIFITGVKEFWTQNLTKKDKIWKPNLFTPVSRNFESRTHLPPCNNKIVF